MFPYVQGPALNRPRWPCPTSAFAATPPRSQPTQPPKIEATRPACRRESRVSANNRSVEQAAKIPAGDADPIFVNRTRISSVARRLKSIFERVRDPKGERNLGIPTPNSFALQVIVRRQNVVEALTLVEKPE